ncbi:BTAD domain-containing putative transcriptional regulator [Streptomyces sp. NPDC017056]|uniref:BTAD domain-containing putative transcriptional regulator n=1 Tax=Streptomyces sp. NPDC017056 TaxID=3364973 RepID=UPI0037955FFC
MDGGVRLRVTLLGAFRVSHGDTALPVPGARLRALAVRLALAGGHAVEQSGLIDAIWAEAPPAGPAHALQALVSRLRRALGSAGDVAQLAGGYRLAVDAADVDALRFERLAAEGRDHLRAGAPQAAAAALGEAVALWGDRPGAEPTVVAAVAPAVATRLAHASAEAVAGLADAELALGRAEAAAARLTALLAEHPAHERAAALLVDALAAQGRQADALALYERVRETLADVLGADPGAALRERHLRLLRAERPATDTAQAGRSNLPAPLTSFVGRDDDLARIGTLLGSGRLVTVLGPGGAGKTRLAVEAARRHRHAYRDGVWMIDLAPVTEPAKFGAALPATIGLRGSALFETSAGLRGDPVGELDVLADRLDGRESLLLVDNCEHVIDAVAHLIAALLSRCAALRVLATSREPLAVDGEALVPLGPLALPGPDEEAGRACRTASVRLFSERAAAVRPGFEVDEHNLAEVLHVVRSLDGLPLALELAAARLRTLALADLASGLSDRFRLLTTGSRTAFPGIARCARSSRGAGTCSVRTPVRSRSASRSCPGASHRPRPPLSARTPGCLPPRSRSCSRAWSTGRCSNSRRTPAGTGCWRPSASTAWSAWQSKAPWPACGTWPPATTPDWSPATTRCSAAPSSSTRSGCCTPSTTTCWPPCVISATPATPTARPPSRWTWPGTGKPPAGTPTRPTGSAGRWRCRSNGRACNATSPKGCWRSTPPPPRARWSTTGSGSGARNCGHWPTGCWVTRSCRASAAY